MTLLLPILLAVAFGAALAAPLVVRLARPAAGPLLALAPAFVLVALLAVLPQIGATPGTSSLAWLPTLGLRLDLRLDGLGALFALLISGVGVAVVIYAGRYMRAHPHQGRFMAWLVFFMAAMLGIALADNLLLLYVAWELTTVSSWQLIGFEHEEEEARQAAWQSLMVTATGGLAMLAGFVLLGQTAGTYSITGLLAQGEEVRASAAYPAILVLLLLGAATKSALFPFHFWLPNAMAAPTPVSAYLHSAAMVNAGIYLLARFSPALGGTTAWTAAVGTLGAVTAVVAAWLALVQTDAKRLLAYTTIGALGMMALALGVGGAEGGRAALAFLFAHALYKGALFMVAGSIDHGAHTRDLSRVGGLWRAMPWTSAAAILAMVSMVGLPPTLGFLGKEELIIAAHDFHAPGAAWLLLAVIVAGALYAGAGFIVGLGPVVGRTRAPEPPHETRAGLWGPPLTLAVVGVLLALVPGRLEHLLVGPAVEAVAGHPPETPLKLWHGVNAPFLIGTALILVGLVLWAFWSPLRRAAGRLAGLGRLGPDAGYRLGERGLLAGAERLDRLLQHGYLPVYLLIVVLTVGVAVGPLAFRAGFATPTPATPLAPYDVPLALFIVAAGVGVILFTSRLASIAFLTAVGFGVAILFALYGAPDLAITQLLVETLLTVLVVLVLPTMPRFTELSGRAVQVRDAVVSLAAGGGLTLLLLTATATEREAPARDYYLTHAPEAGGDNVVNVVLVAFRAVDTLGEVAVLSAAALGVLALFAAARS